MDRVTKQRYPKRQAAGRKAHEKYVAKLKEDILVKNVGSSSSNSTSGGINTTNDSTSGDSDATSTTTSSTITNYIHEVGAIKLMRNPPEPDKDSEKISKEPEKISKIRRKRL